MLYTSAEAGKLLKRLNEELQYLRSMEDESAVFEAALNENVEEVRPEYDFDQAQKEQAELEEKIRKVKHALVLFNAATKVEGTEMTIDEVLVYIPQLTAKKMKLNVMRSRLPKSRVNQDSYGRSGSNIISYQYANYKVEDAKAEFDRVSKELADLQNALDLTNTKETLEIDVEI